MLFSDEERNINLGNNQTSKILRQEENKNSEQNIYPCLQLYGAVQGVSAAAPRLKAPLEP